MPEWLDGAIDVLVGALPYLLGVVGVLLLVSLIDGHRRHRPGKQPRETTS